MFGKEAKKKELIANLGDIFALLQRQHQVSEGDFPNLERMKVCVFYGEVLKTEIDGIRQRGGGFIAFGPFCPSSFFNLHV